MSRRKSSADRSSVQSRLLTSSAPVGPGAEVEEPARPRRGSAPPSPPRPRRGFSTRSADLPLGSPISPVAPPTSPIGRCPASWKRRMVSSRTRLPMCRPGAVGSKPPYRVTGPAASALRRSSRSVDSGDQAAPGQFVDDVVSHRCIVPSRRARRVETRVCAAGVAPAAGHVRPVHRHGRVAGRARTARASAAAADPDPRAPLIRPAGRAAVPAADPQRRARVAHVRAVQRPVDAQRLAQPGRAAGQVPLRAAARPAARPADRRDAASATPSVTRPARSSTAAARRRPARRPGSRRSACRR